MNTKTPNPKKYQTVTHVTSALDDQEAEAEPVLPPPKHKPLPQLILVAREEPELIRLREALDLAIRLRAVLDQEPTDCRGWICGIVMNLTDRTQAMARKRREEIATVQGLQ